MSSDWELILQEVVNKYQPSATFRFTHRARNNSRNKKTNVKKPAKTYALGPKYQNINLTPQESECMKLAIRGKTIPKIATALNLSPRTVEFYFGKMRKKLQCSTKSELIEKVIESDFLKNLAKSD